MNIGIFGNLSAGKSSLAMILSKYNNKKVISNTYCSFADQILPFEEIIDKLDKEAQTIEKPEESTFFKSILILDEVHLVANSRRSGSDLNLKFTTFITQMGKLDCDLIYTSQTFESQVDKIIRDLSDMIITVMRVDQNGSPVIDDRIVSYKVYIKGEIWLKLYGGLKWVRKSFVVDPEEIFGCYNTREIVMLDRSKYLKRNTKPNHGDGLYS